MNDRLDQHVLDSLDRGEVWRPRRIGQSPVSWIVTRLRGMADNAAANGDSAGAAELRRMADEKEKSNE